jgi:hypothetical protein
MYKPPFWNTKPSSIEPGTVAYFGRYSSMPRGQRVAVIAEACGGYFQVAPLLRRKRCGRVRIVKRKYLAPVQPDFFFSL